MLLDTHVHLQDRAYQEDLEAVLKRAAQAGVAACIVPGIDVETSRAAVALATRYADAACVLYAAVGIHPTSADELTPDALAILDSLAQHPRVVAIGEIGLDYYWPHNPQRKWDCAAPPQQRAALEQQLELAARRHLPVIFHDRDAHDDTLALLNAWIADDKTRTGTLHAYAAGSARLEQALDLGFYLGIDGPITFRQATDLHAVAQQLPLERLLLETDGPYLTPVPHRGTRNEPAYLTYVAARIAALRNTTIETVTAAATANARQLFGLQ